MKCLILAVSVCGAILVNAAKAQEAIRDCARPTTPATSDVCLDEASSGLSASSFFNVSENLARIAATSSLSAKQRQRADALLAAAYWENDRKDDARQRLESIVGSSPDLNSLRLDTLDAYDRAIVWFTLVQSEGPGTRGDGMAVALRRLTEDFTAGLQSHGLGYPFPKNVALLLQRLAVDSGVDALGGIAGALEQHVPATNIQRAELRLMEAQSARIAGRMAAVGPALERAKSWLPPPGWRASLVANSGDAVDLSDRSPERKAADVLWMKVTFLQGVAAFLQGNVGAAYSSLMLSAWSAERSRNDDGIVGGELSNIFHQLSTVSMAAGAILTGRIQTEAAEIANKSGNEQLSLDLLRGRIQFERLTAPAPRLAILADRLQRKLESRILGSDTWLQDDNLRQEVLDAASLLLFNSARNIRPVPVLNAISRYTNQPSEASDALALLAGADVAAGRNEVGQQRLAQAKLLAAQLAGRRKNGAWATALYARVNKDAATEAAALREASGSIDKLEQLDDIVVFWRLAEAEEAAGNFGVASRVLQTLWIKLNEVQGLTPNLLAETQLRLARASFLAGEQETGANLATALANWELTSGVFDPVRLAEAATIIAVAGHSSAAPGTEWWARLARWYGTSAVGDDPRMRIFRNHEATLKMLASRPSPGVGIDGLMDAPDEILPKPFSRARAHASLDPQQMEITAARASYDGHSGLVEALSALADLRASEATTVDRLELHFMDQVTDALQRGEATACDDFIVTAEFLGQQAPSKAIADKIDSVFANSPQQKLCTPAHRLRIGAVRTKIAIEVGDPIEDAIVRIESLISETSLGGRLPSDHPLAEAIVALSASIDQSGAGNLRYRIVGALPFLFGGCPELC